MRVININTTSPAFNLAAEEHMFEGAVSGCPLCLIWQNSDSLIVGVNQNTLAEINAAEAQRQDVKVIRRLSGGGAVFHDLNNVNYTFITDGSAKFGEALAAFTAPVADFLASIGVKAELNGRNDICVNGRKVSGTAQYTKNGFTLFHGTLLFRADGERIASLLRCDPEKYTRRGIASVSSRVCGIEEYLQQPMSVREFRASLCRFLAGASQPEGLTEKDIPSILALRKRRYDTDEWNYGHFTGYGYTKKARFPYGGVEIGLDISGGVIRDARITGDFFSVKPVEELERLLTGRSHSPAGLKGIHAGGYIAGMTDSEFTDLIL